MERVTEEAKEHEKRVTKDKADNKTIVTDKSMQRYRYRKRKQNGADKAQTAKES